MDQGNPSSSTIRKPRFIPNVPKRRPPARSSGSLKGRGAGDDAVESERLLRRFQERTQRHRPTTERRSSARVTFGGGAPTTSTSSGKNAESSGVADDSNLSEDSDRPIKDISNSSSSDKEEVYREPWDCEGSYYPTTLPLRRPYSGNPEILDEAEFGEATTKSDYDETKMNAAKELGLLARNGSEKPRLLFFQLPPLLPLAKEPSSRKGKEIVEISDLPDKRTKESSSVHSMPTGTAPQTSKMCLSWKDLPSGHMGKLLVYKSGRVKLKLGDTLYDVTPGSEGEASDDAMAMNPKERQCCRLGDIGKHAVVSIDVDSILDRVADEKQMQE